MMPWTVGIESMDGGYFDIKNKWKGGHYGGYRVYGKYASSRQIGNMLAGLNARLQRSVFSYDQFQRMAGMVHQKQGKWGITRGYFGDYVGEAPYYGENAYQYESSKYGWDVLADKFNKSNVQGVAPGLYISP